MIDHDIVGLHISVHNSHAVAIIQGLWEEQGRKERACVRAAYFFSYSKSFIVFFHVNFLPGLTVSLGIWNRTFTHTAILHFLVQDSIAKQIQVLFKDTKYTLMAPLPIFPSDSKPRLFSQTQVLQQKKTFLYYMPLIWETVIFFSSQESTTESASYHPLAKPGLLPVPGKLLLEHSHIYLLPYCLWGFHAIRAELNSVTDAVAQRAIHTHIHPLKKFTNPEFRS